jgi:glucokinase
MSSTTVGVDVGGTKLAVATLAGGTLGDPVVRRTERGGAEELIAEIVIAVQGAVTRECEAVGVGVPSVVEFASGRVRSSVNVPLEDVPLREVLEEALGMPAYVDNDATLAALAEAFEGGRIATRNLVMLTVGTGLGGGLVLNGRVYRGATGAAGEVGHTIVGAELERGAPPSSGFPQPGTLESYASGTALDRLAAAAAAAEPGSALGRLVREGGAPDGRDAVEAAKQGDVAARRVLTVLGERLGIGIANAINTIDPDVVAIGGGVSAAGELLLGPARETASRFVLPGVGERTEIRVSRHGPEAGVLGAALLARQELEDERGRGAAEGGDDGDGH